MWRALCSINLAAILKLRNCSFSTNLQMRKLRRKEVKWLSQSHMASLWQSQYLNLENLVPEVVFLATSYHCFWYTCLLTSQVCRWCFLLSGLRRVRPRWRTLSSYILNVTDHSLRGKVHLPASSSLAERLPDRIHTESEIYNFITLAISHHVLSGSPCINIAFLWKITLLLVSIKPDSEFPVNAASWLIAVLPKQSSLLVQRMYVREALVSISHRLDLIYRIIDTFKMEEK
jgi:hypothetical protein